MRISASCCKLTAALGRQQRLASLLLNFVYLSTASYEYLEDTTVTIKHRGISVNNSGGLQSEAS